MDDYRDLVLAAFALLCAALMLVAGLLLLRDKPAQGSADPRLERPEARGATTSATATFRLTEW
jgi:hypothetical protein